MSRENLSKSEMIRRHITEHPDAGPTEIANFLNAKDKSLNITPSLVSLVKGKMANKKTTTKSTNGRKKSKLTSRMSTRNPNGSITMSELMEAKEIVSRLGGIDRAKELLDDVQQLQLS